MLSHWFEAPMVANKSGKGTPNDTLYARRWRPKANALLNIGDRRPIKREQMGLIQGFTRRRGFSYAGMPYRFSRRLQRPLSHINVNRASGRAIFAAVFTGARAIGSPRRVAVAPLIVFTALNKRLHRHVLLRILLDFLRRRYRGRLIRRRRGNDRWLLINSNHVTTQTARTTESETQRAPKCELPLSIYRPSSASLESFLPGAPSSIECASRKRLSAYPARRGS